MSSLVFFNFITSLFIVITFNIFGSCTSVELQVITQPEAILEGPIWSVQENALYWVNTFGQTVFRMDGHTGEITTRYIHHGPTLAIMPVRDYPGYIVVSVRTSLYLLKWGAPGGDSALRLLTIVDRGKPDNNIDYMNADTLGRLWFGTIGKYNSSLKTLVPPDEATLYSIDAFDFVRPAVRKRPVTISKGPVWSFDDTKMYHNDALTRRITAFDYDLKKGDIANETVVFSFDDHDIPGIADGMTLDAKGNLWVATMRSMIINIDPRSGQLLRKIELPVDQVTAVAWGGPLMDTLYATTAALGVLHPQPLSGTLLKLTNLGVFGFPVNQFVFPDAPNY